jgi:hypothetical protein
VAGISAGAVIGQKRVIVVLAMVLSVVGLWLGPPGVADAQSGEWTREHAPPLSNGAVTADQTGAFTIRMMQVSAPGAMLQTQFMLDQYAADGAFTRKWTSAVHTYADYNPHVATYEGTAYTSIEENNGSGPPLSTVRQHPANGTPGWTQSHPRVEAMIADAGGVYLLGIQAVGPGFGYFIQKLDPATGAEIWAHAVDYAGQSAPGFGKRHLALGDDSLYVYASYFHAPSSETRSRMRRLSLTDGTELWQPPLELPRTPSTYGIAATSGGVYAVLPYLVTSTPSVVWGARMTRFGLDKSVAWTGDIAVSGEDFGIGAGISADASGFSLLFSKISPSPNDIATVRKYGPTGTEIGNRTFPLLPFPSDSVMYTSDFVARDGSVYVLGAYAKSEPADSRQVLARLLPMAKPRGKVTWSDAYPDKVGQGVQGATVTVGSQTFQTDAQGEYEITPDLLGQNATVTLPIFDHSGAGALVGPDGNLIFAKASAAAAGSNISMSINEQIKLDIDPNTGKLKTTATFGKNVQFKGFGQTFNLTNLKLTDQGVETVGGTAQLAFKYDANSPPAALNVTINYTKSNNHLMINGVSGSQFQLGGQTATLTKFALVSSPTVNTVSMEGTVSLSLSGVPISATIKGDGTAQGVVLSAKGNAIVQGITVEFDPITVENGQFHVKGRVKLPNQSVYLAFDTTSGFNVPDLVLPLPLFKWDGQTLPVELVLRGSALVLRGTGSIQIGGQAVQLALDTNVIMGPGTTIVKASAVIPLPDGGTATAKLEFDPTKPQNTAVTGTMKVFLALCPSKKTEFNVDVRASASNIKLGFTTSVPIDCDGNGSSTLVDIKGDFDGQLAQLQVAWPVSIGNTNGRVSANVKSDGTFFEIMFNVELKFGPGGARASSAGTGGAANARAEVGTAAASDVRVLLTDGVGRRTGFDPATGQIVLEIPGGRWDGLVNGMDSFTMPGRVGGYVVTLHSATAQTVNLAITTGGQTKTLPASVGPGVATTIAAETVPLAGGLSAQIGAVAVGCAPRPRVQVSPAPGGGALRATFTAEPGSSVATNAIREIRIGQNAVNGLVDAHGRTGLRGGAVITFPSPVTSATLTVRRERPNEPTTVPLTIVDGCGEWTTFVGGGTSAGF